MTSPSALLISGLTPAVGSSSRIALGASIRAREISSSFFCPPDRFFAGSLASGHRFTCSSRVRARAMAAACSARTRPRAAKLRHTLSPHCAGLASSMFSSTVNSPSSREIWNVRTRPRRASSSGRRPAMSCPSNLSVPASGGNRPPRILKSVDLPAPLGPMMPVMLCAPMSMLQPFRAWNPPKDFDTLCALSIMGSGKSAVRELRVQAALPRRHNARRLPAIIRAVMVNECVSA